jgi:hypothetical protein
MAKKRHIDVRIAEAKENLSRLNDDKKIEELKLKKQGRSPKKRRR